MAEIFGLSETVVRLGSFAGVFAVMAAAEMTAPRRPLHYNRWNRWFTNLGVVVVDGLFVRLLFPVVAVGAALTASEKGYGLFNITDWPVWLEMVLAIIFLDMAIYWQHVVFHKVPLLWRLHKVHHADPDYDLTTALRFHPIEIGLSMILKIILVFLIGPAVAAVILFEVVLNGMAMFNHANFKLPLGIDRLLRKVLVTPDMHRVHHSNIQIETDSNYGFNLSIWDRLFGSYRDQPEAGHEGMTIGLEEYQSAAPTRLDWVLLVPFQAVEKQRGERQAQ